MRRANHFGDPYGTFAVTPRGRRHIVIGAATTGALLVATLVIVTVSGNRGSRHTGTSGGSSPGALIDNDESPRVAVERIERSLLDEGLPPGAAVDAARSLSGYIESVARRDIAHLERSAREHGAGFDPFMLEMARKHLSILPASVRAADGQPWTDDRLLRQHFRSSPDRWQRIDADNITVTRFQGPGTLMTDLGFYRGGLKSDGSRSSVYASPFAIPDLERRLQEGEAAGAVVTFPVTNQDGEKQLVTILLGEYSPGRWFPVRHRTLSFAQAGAR